MVEGSDLKTGIDLLIHTLLLVSEQCAIPGSDNTPPDTYRLADISRRVNPITDRERKNA